MACVHAAAPMAAELRPAPKYFRDSGSWYQALEGRFHQVHDGRIIVALRTGVGRVTVERWAADLGLELGPVGADSEAQLLVPANADPFELLQSVESANLTDSAKFPLASNVLEELRADAMVIGGRRFARPEGVGWSRPTGANTRSLFNRRKRNGSEDRSPPVASWRSGIPRGGCLRRWEADTSVPATLAAA